MDVLGYALGSTEGVIDIVLEGYWLLVLLGIFEGLDDGSKDGTEDGILEGDWLAVRLGACEGLCEGKTEGALNDIGHIDVRMCSFMFHRIKNNHQRWSHTFEWLAERALDG